MTRDELAALASRHMKATFAIAIAVLVGGGWALYSAPTQQSGVRRVDLQRRDLALAGREVVQVRVELAPGIASGNHWHPGEEIVYVLEGSLEYSVQGERPVTLKAGEVLFIPARAIHTAKNVGTVIGAELATYIVEKGKPLVVMIADRK